MNLSDQFVPQGLDSIGADQWKARAVETVAGNGRPQDFAWNFHTYSTLITQYEEYSLYTVCHSKYSF